MYILQQLANYDQRIFLWCASLCRSRNLPGYTRIISHSGDGYLQVLMPLLIIAIVGHDALPFLKLIVFSFAIERSLYWLLKNNLKRKRPEAALPTFKATISASDEFSFPSGHTSAAFLLAILVHYQQSCLSGQAVSASLELFLAYIFLPTLSLAFV